MERAFVCVATKSAAYQKVIEKIKSVEGVEEASCVRGAYDVCFCLKEENLDKLKKALSETAEAIKKVSDIRETLTLFEAESKQVAERSQKGIWSL